MLPKKARLPAASFNIKGGRTFSDGYFKVQTKENLLGYSRVGFIISNKVDKRSSRRHFLKRRLEEMFKKSPTKGVDVLIVVKPNLNNLSLEQIKIEATKILARI